jgi:large subunit ribosomal protein L5
MSQVLKERYQKEVAPALMKALNLSNVMQVPRVEKVVVNIGLGEALENAKALDAAVGDLTQITVALLVPKLHCAESVCGLFWIV